MACPQVVSKAEIQERVKAYQGTKANEMVRFCAQNPEAGMCVERRRAEKAERDMQKRRAEEEKQRQEAAERAERLRKEEAARQEQSRREQAAQKALEGRCRVDATTAECRPPKGAVGSGGCRG
jgi:hypothetical protein